MFCCAVCLFDRQQFKTLAKVQCSWTNTPPLNNSEGRRISRHYRNEREIIQRFHSAGWSSSSISNGQLLCACVDWIKRRFQSPSRLHFIERQKSLYRNSIVGSILTHLPPSSHPTTQVNSMMTFPKARIFTRDDRNVTSSSAIENRDTLSSPFECREDQPVPWQPTTWILK